jgi:hypothetical protein
MSNKLVKENATESSKYSLWNFYVLMVLCVLSVASLVLNILAYSDVRALKTHFLGEETTEVTATPSPTPEVSVEEHTHTEDEIPNLGELSMGEEYTGFFAQSLSNANLTLHEVTNTADYMGSDFTGKIYTLENNTYMTTEAPTTMKVGDVAIDIKDPTTFDALKDKGFSLVTDENGNAYELAEGEDTYFFARGIASEVSNDLGETAKYSVGYICVNDYEKCKDMDISMYGNLTMNSTIEETVQALGTPTYVDIYESNDEEIGTYVMLYYSQADMEKLTIDEISIIFQQDDTAPNGYFLSEVTASMF